MSLENAKDDRDIEKILQEEEDKELLHLLWKQNRRICFCFKKKVSKDIAERLKDHLAKFPQFEVMLAYEDIDIERILKAGSNTQVVDDFGKVYQAKEHHSKWRKRIINC